MTEEVFDSGFPQKIRNEYEHVMSLICQADDGSARVEHGYNSEKEIYILSDGTQINFPYRIYCPDDDQAYFQLTDNEKMIYDCIFSRSNDGHIREKHIRNILLTGIPEWCFPYIVRSSGDYVLEIIDTIYEHLRVRDNNLLQVFCRRNPEFVKTNYRRMYSYWHEYYRRDYPKISTYTGMRLFYECLLPDLGLHE